MLIQFCFQNYRSFKEEAILDLTATRTTECTNHIVQIGNEKLLPTAAIYGANASGKSNVIKAFRFMRKYVLNSLFYGDEETIDESAIQKPARDPFLFDEGSRQQESSFEVYFILEQNNLRSYNYGFTLDESGVVEEWLNTKAKTAREYKSIFYRNRKEQELDLSGLPAKIQENIRVSLENETLIVSLGAKLRVEQCKLVRDWFQSVNFADFGNPFENVLLSSIVPDGFVENPAVQKKVADYLAAFDPTITGFEIEKVPHIDGEPEKIKLKVLHRMIERLSVSLPMEEESDGTQKMFALYRVLQRALDNGSLLVIDELNARLHPLLVRNFLITFLDPKNNPHHAQLIFTTHDTWLLANDLLRRDEIWFTDKGLNGATTLSSLVDFVDQGGDKIRKDENFEKNYLLGKYRAIPHLRRFDILQED